jgi:hypothetical protein
MVASCCDPIRYKGLYSRACTRVGTEVCNLARIMMLLPSGSFPHGERVLLGSSPLGGLGRLD